MKKALVKAGVFAARSGVGCIRDFGSGWDERREKQICISFLNFEQAGTRGAERTTVKFESRDTFC